MNVQPPPFIPENAPFTVEQRAYLNGFLAGLFPSGGQALPNGQSESNGPGALAPVTILWGSQTGNTETLAKKAAKRLSKSGFEPTVVDMSEYDRGKLGEEKNVLVMTSTYGDGDPPDNAMDLHAWLGSAEAPKLDGVRYSVLALGDTNYPDFCKCGIEFDERLASLGAVRLADRVDCDVDFEDSYLEWIGSVEKASGVPEAGDAIMPEKSVKIEYNKRNPFVARVLENVNLNQDGSQKETRHIEISLKDSGLEYQPGDALAVVPENDTARVDELIGALSFDPESEVELADGDRSSLRDALRYSCDIAKLSLKIAKGIAEATGDERLQELVSDRKRFAEYAEGRELLDLVGDYGLLFKSPANFVSQLSKLAPRLYSISSSPKAHAEEVHLTVGVVRYETHGRSREGVCSNFLARRALEDSVRIFFHHTKSFKLPENGDAPVVMVGPGTGVAPFRAFIEERRATGAKGENWLFFGDQRAQSDFLYQNELEDHFRAGALSRLDTAFSRDQAEKVYVQDRMIEHGAELFAWLERGAYFYVCGDASRMAKDVDAALHAIVETHGGMDAAGAEGYVKELKASKRYLRDVY